MNENRKGCRRPALMLAAMLLPAILGAQINHPAGGYVFDDSAVPRIHISITPVNLAALYAEPYSDYEFKALFTFIRGDSVENLTDVGLSLRGNTSRGNQKKSFRISFNSFDAGRDFHGIEKMNLNARTNDPSLVRSMLSWKLYRYLGVPGSRANHVLLYINNDFYGVYINTEHVDEKFVRSRFGTNDGNLYKCLWPADLVYLGADQDSYKAEFDGRRAYEQVINEEWDDYGDLAGLIGTLDRFSGAPLKDTLERILNVQQYLKVMAVDVMTGNWDGYIGNRNNFFLYRDPVTGRFEYIPYDLDNTFGIDWLGLEWADRSIYSWHREERPLYEKLLQIDDYREQFTGYVRKLADYMSSDTLMAELERWRSQISNAVEQDPYYPLDWGYGYADFQNALDSAWGGHVFHGIADFMALRVASALAEAEPTDPPPLISHARLLPGKGRIDVDWVAEDDQPGFTTAFHYRINQTVWQTVPVQDPALTDPFSGLQSYRDSLLSIGDNDLVEFYFTVTDQGGQEGRFPAGSLAVRFPLARGPLFINEFMASNSSIRMDQYGQYEDWVEIFNPTDSMVWLGDVYLSDRMGDPGRYRFPGQYIEPGGFYVVWLDGTPEQGVNHASFKIDKDGEELRLSDRPARGFSLMDSITFGPQYTDVALGRATDGGVPWISFNMPTPGYSNLLTGWASPAEEEPALQIWPNPVQGGTLHFSRRISGVVYNMLGEPVIRLLDDRQAETGGLSPGIYIIRSDGGEVLQFAVTGR